MFNKNTKKRVFPTHLFSLIIFIASVNFLASIFSWYWRIKWLDMFMHFLGGFWIGAVVLWFALYINLYITRTLKKRRVLLFITLILSSLAIGILWELFEFGVNYFVIFSTQNEIIDTISDLIFDLSGAIMAFVYYRKSIIN